MNRTDGLVRRVKSRANENTSNDPSESGATSNEVNENDIKVELDNDIEEGDSKETRLTLMEEVLLLGLKDKEVS